MHWIAPSEKHTYNAALERTSGTPPTSSAPVLGLIFLRFAEEQASSPTHAH